MIRALALSSSVSVLLSVSVSLSLLLSLWHAFGCNRRWLLILMQLLIPFLGIRHITFTTFFVLLVVTIYLCTHDCKECHKCCVRRFELLACSRIAKNGFHQNTCLLVSQILDSFGTVELEDNTLNFPFCHPD